MLLGGGSPVLSAYGQWRGPGHCAVLMEGDSSWLVYHAYDTQNNGTPTLRISGLDWDEDGWPYVDELYLSVPNTSEKIPPECSLFQNYPNPFNSSTTITYSIVKSSWVNITIHDLLGQNVDTLVCSKLKSGEYTFMYRPENLPSGVYLYRLESDTFAEARKLIYLK